jgi:phospholipid transport system transporter-binding protein
VSGADISRSGTGRYAISGELTFSTVPDVRRNALDEVSDNPVQVDLAGITRVDSAGIALLIELIRTVRKRGGDITLTHAPPQLMAIARVSGLDTVLPFVSEGNSSQ